jgi:hypothetical protein
MLSRRSEMLHKRSVALREPSVLLQERSTFEEERSLVFLGSAARPVSRSGDLDLDSSCADERSSGELEPSGVCLGPSYRYLSSEDGIS